MGLRCTGRIKAARRTLASAFALLALILVVGMVGMAGMGSVLADDEARPASGSDESAKISYYDQIRPIFQAQCQGCHQPAKASGSYVMTAFDKLVAGGESKMAAVAPGKPNESYLLELITPTDGKAQMPQGKPPLAAAEIELIRNWIAQGAVDDTPAAAQQRFDQDHPPIYTRPPVITALDYSPDGKLLAVAGFHEVLLVRTADNQLDSRLVGMSERIQSVRFSPDGARLAVVGGLPCRMGEVQIWNVADRKLQLSVPMTHDTLYGGSWSPDGKTIAFGCADNTVRAIDSESGKQVLFQGAHTDWVRATAFSKDGSNLVSVDRDGAAKLTELATERFVDNITSITPGALKGGLTAVVRHPDRDEVVLGGSDGRVKVYRIFRITARKIGDDANLIRQMPPMLGRIFGVDVSRDGKRIAAVSTLNGESELQVTSYEFDTALPKDIEAINGKTVQQRTPEEKARLEAYQREGVKAIAQVKVPDAAIYTVAFHPEGKLLALAGNDGQVRVFEAATGQAVQSFSPAPIAANATDMLSAASVVYRRPTPRVESEALPAGMQIASLSAQPESIELFGPGSYVQLLVQAKLTSGDTVDVTRLVTSKRSANLVEVSASGLVQPVADGQGTLTLAAQGKSVTVPLAISGMQTAMHADFVREVNPVLSRLGCNQGTCHGAAKGKNGFKLSLRGYDPIFDVRALTDDLSARRVNLASPDDSLMLLKATGAVPHQGGKLIDRHDTYYAILRSWIANGAKLETAAPRVTKIDLVPQNPIVQRVGSRQQVRVLATYADDSVRDVTQEAYVETGNMEVATTERGGLLTPLRRGEAPILARFEGAYAATTLSVMGDRGGFQWKQPPTFNKIDELTADKWQRMKILPSEVCSDTDFIRRVYLDVTGLPPKVEDVQAFLADPREQRVKREELIDRLVGSEEFIEYWTNKWADLLQVNRKFLGPEGASQFRGWIRGQIAANRPYDEFAYEILTASGSNKENPAASYYKILREPVEIMENTTHLFLAVRFNCNKCHDHPFERWTQDQYYETAAYFAQVGLKADPAAGDKKIGGTAVEGAKPLYEVVFDQTKGDVVHERTGQPAPPEFPFDCQFEAPENASRRTELAAWITSPNNPYFARSYVNRLWGYMFGVGIMEPIDDIRAGNPPSNPELLDYLTQEFLASDFNVQHLIKLICKSRTYQLSVATNQWNEDDTINYSHAVARRLPAEVLYDAIQRVTGSVSRFPGVAPGTRASALPDSGVELPSGFLAKFGRPPRESACECERVNSLQLGPVMALISGPTLAEAIADPKNELARLATEQKDDQALVNDVFMRILSRSASEAEIAASLELMQEIPTDHAALSKRLAAMEARFADGIAAMEAERQTKVDAAKTALDAYAAEIADREADLDRKHAEALAKAEAALKEYESTLAEKQSAWETNIQQSTVWTALDPHDLTSTFNAKLKKESDLAITVTGANNKGSYIVQAKTSLIGITGVRLEALADDKLPSKGPGRAQNGNFVLTEFRLEAGPEGQANDLKKVTLQNAQADFSQNNYAVATAIDGKLAPASNGWAISDQFGKNHTAVFETAENLGEASGTLLKFFLDHQYQDGLHTLGKFRISVTTSPRPIRLEGLSPAIAAILKVPADKRDKQQLAELTRFYRENDGELKKLTDALAKAKLPRAVDPKLKRLQDALAKASLPVPLDPKLVQLRADVKMSELQAANARLTAVQDLAWALLNSPAFLFNH